MMTRVALVGLTLSTAVLVTEVARAGIIFNNGSPADSALGSTSDFSSPQQQSAESFTLFLGRSTIDGIHWWGSYYPDDMLPLSDDFMVRIFEDDSGLPATNPIFEELVGDVGRMVTNLTSFGNEVYRYSAAIAPTALAPGFTYWLSIVNNTPSEPDRWVWTETDLDIDNLSIRRLGDDQPWRANGFFDLAFNLTGSGAVSVDRIAWGQVKSLYR